MVELFPAMENESNTSNTLCSVGDLFFCREYYINDTLAALKSNAYSKKIISLGNDAAIVAIYASQLGLHSEFFSASVHQSCNPLVDYMKRCNVNCLVSFDQNAMSDSIVIIDPLGRRTFIGAQKDTHSYSIDCITSAFFYLDLYDENIISRLGILHSLTCKNDRHVYLNLSSSSIDKKLEAIADVYVDFVQVGFERNGTISEIRDMARNVFDKVSARSVVLTLGKSGAAIYCSSGFHYVPCKNTKTAIQITGAGAAFSAAFIKAHMYNEDCFQSLEDACQFASEKCLESDGFHLINLRNSITDTHGDDRHV